MKVGTIVNIMNVYNRYQYKINADIERVEYFKSIGSKLGIEQAQAQLNKDKAEMSEFLDYEI